MRAMFDALLAAATPSDAPAELYAVVIDGGDGAIERAVALLGEERVLDARSMPDGPNPVLQPADRGSLAAVLAALVDLIPRDPEAIVLITGTPIAPAALVGALERVVHDPDLVATIREDCETFAVGLGVVAEARGLLRRAFAGAPEWAEAMCDTALAPLERAAVYRALAPGAFEDLVRDPMARVRADPGPSVAVA